LAAFGKSIAVVEAGLHRCPRQTIKSSMTLLVALLGVCQNIPQIHSSLIPDVVVRNQSRFEQLDEKRL
jgi:hypothetical protein